MPMSADLIDTGIISDIYADGIGAVDDLGDCLRLTFFTKVRSSLTGQYERVVVARLIRPKKTLMFGRLRELAKIAPRAEDDQTAIVQLRGH